MLLVVVNTEEHNGWHDPVMNLSVVQRIKTLRMLGAVGGLFLGPFLSYFFVTKIPLSRRVEYVMDGSLDQ